MKCIIVKSFIKDVDFLKKMYCYAFFLNNPFLTLAPKIV